MKTNNKIDRNVYKIQKEKHLYAICNHLFNGFRNGEHFLNEINTLNTYINSKGNNLGKRRLFGTPKTSINMTSTFFTMELQRHDIHNVIPPEFNSKFEEVVEQCFSYIDRDAPTRHRTLLINSNI